MTPSLAHHRTTLCSQAITRRAELARQRARGSVPKVKDDEDPTCAEKPAITTISCHIRSVCRVSAPRPGPSAARLKYLYDLMRENQVCELSRWDCGMVTGTF